MCNAAKHDDASLGMKHAYRLCTMNAKQEEQPPAAKRIKMEGWETDPRAAMEMCRREKMNAARHQSALSSGAMSLSNKTERVNLKLWERRRRRISGTFALIAPFQMILRHPFVKIVFVIRATCQHVSARNGYRPTAMLETILRIG